MLQFDWFNVLHAAEHWLMPFSCVVCGCSARQRDICRDCALELPWNRDCCRRCALPLARPAILCGQCSTRLPPWFSARSAFVYDFPVNSLLRKLKFSRQLPNGRVLGELTAEWIASFDDEKPNIIVPVPLHWRRQIKRQFNQAEEIARPISRRLKIPLANNLCYRRRATKQQHGLTATLRRRNLRDAFLVKGNTEQTHIALVDDVMTTGSTLRELSKAFLQSGASRIDVWTAARVADSGHKKTPSRQGGG
ncbi:MAG: ComF family protein [Gammaproteobacteria bacterium]|nr:ComF family protein [Gammaproteobacteria bacterium]